MQSFAIWCKKKTSPTSSSYIMDLHVNLWDLTDESPYIDFGIKIQNFRDLLQICVQFPFYITNNEIEDLSVKLTQRNIAYLIFNDDCKVISDRHLFKIQPSTNTSDDDLLLYVISENGFDIKNNPAKTETYLHLPFEKIIGNDKFNGCQNLYIRFRINSDKIKEELFCKIKDKNKYFESAFIKHDILDFKINKIRNLSEESIDRFRTDHYELACFKKIHLLVMESSEKEISLFSSPFQECRRLENGWIEYLRDGKQTKTKRCDDIIAYHWKKTPEPDKESIKEYSNMIKISGSVSSAKVIIIYIMVVLVLGVSGSLIATFINHIFTPSKSPYSPTTEVSSDAFTEDLSSNAFSSTDTSTTQE